MTGIPSFTEDMVCATQLGFSYTVYSGGEYGVITLGFWRGTDEYFVTEGECGVRNSSPLAVGEKGYIGSASSSFFS